MIVGGFERPGMSATARVGRPRKAARGNAREDLLKAAHKLMAERGMIDVPVSDIAALAGLNVALVSYYFGSKDRLLLELALRHHAHFGEELDQLLANEEPAPAKLRVHIRAMIRAFRRVPYLQRLNHRILRGGAPEAAEELAKVLVAPLAVFYARLIDQGVAEGSFRRIEPMHLYLTVVGACDMLFAAEASLRFGFGVDAVDDVQADGYAEHLATTLLTGLQTPA